MTGLKFSVGIVVALIVGLVIGYYLPGKEMVPADDQTPITLSGVPASQVDFKSAMRKLWEDHITWTRLYIVEKAGGLKGADVTAARLLKNQEDIGNAVKAYYGSAAGNQLTALLKVHITGAVEVLAAAIAGEKNKLDAASLAWYKNADDIAIFLSTANPENWPQESMKGGMTMHLDLTLAEAVDQLKGDYNASVADYDKVHEHILGLADLLSSGIIKQYPDKFK